MKRSLFNQITEILRTTKFPQCYGSMTDGEGAYCANGAIALNLGLDVPYHRTLGSSTFYNLIDLGIPADGIQTLNDFDKLTFSEIAYLLELNSDKFVTEEDLVPDHVPSEWSELVEI